VDEATLERLLRVADDCGADPVAVAASLLHDVLADDEAAHTDAAPLTDAVH